MLDRSIRTIVAAAAFLALGVFAAFAQAAQADEPASGSAISPTVLRDRSGGTAGTIERDAFGSGFVLRDRSGRTIGILKSDFYGDGLVLRDRSGRTIGVLAPE